jgi:hypothetical protein
VGAYNKVLAIEVSHLIINVFLVMDDLVSVLETHPFKGNVR